MSKWGWNKRIRDVEYMDVGFRDFSVNCLVPLIDKLGGVDFASERRLLRDILMDIVGRGTCRTLPLPDKQRRQTTPLAHL